MSPRPAIVSALLVTACHLAPHPPARAPAPIVVPRATGPITIDGRLEEPDWQRAWRSPVLEDSRGRSAPYADVRLMGDDEKLYVAVYVADDDLRTRPREGDLSGAGDEVRLSVGPLRIVLTPGGAGLTDGVQAAMDVDGTVDRSDDMDEEWVTELSIPWSAIGGQTARTQGVRLRALRLDAWKGPERALAWPRADPALLQLAAR